MKLQETPAKRCLTASGWLLHKGKILMIKHKMLGIWLSPGGHVDPHELPHHAAEREFLEETGVKVRTVSSCPLPNTSDDLAEDLPLPFKYNLHWINKPGEKKARADGTICEQHYVFGFFVEPINPKKLEVKFGDEGVDDIRWFAEEEVETIETTPTIKEEMRTVFSCHPAKKK